MIYSDMMIVMQADIFGGIAVERNIITKTRHRENMWHI